MTESLQLLEHPFAIRLGETLVHFVWQGAGWALVGLMLVVALRRASAEARYVALMMVLVGMGLSPVVTFFVIGSPARPSVADVPAVQIPVEADVTAAALSPKADATIEDVATVDELSRSPAVIMDWAEGRPTRTWPAWVTRPRESRSKFRPWHFRRTAGCWRRAAWAHTGPCDCGMWQRAKKCSSSGSPRS